MDRPQIIKAAVQLLEDYRAVHGHVEAQLHQMVLNIKSADPTNPKHLEAVVFYIEQAQQALESERKKSEQNYEKWSGVLATIHAEYR